MRWICVIVLCVAALGGAGCTYASDLDRAQNHFQANRHEQALALFRVLERDMNSFSAEEQARYAYLRGMNDYRLSGQKEDAFTTEATAPTEADKAFRSHARYWLGMARSLEKNNPGSLRSEWKTNADAAMRDLNQDVYGAGVFVDDESGGASEDEDSGS